MKKPGRRAERRANETYTVFNSIADGIIVYDSEGRARRTNQAAVEMLGFDPTDENIAGLAKALSTRTMDGRPLDLTLAPTARALRGQPVVGERYILQNPRGKDSIVVASASPLWTGDKITGAVAVWQDVTEEYKAEETRAWLASFPELNPNPVVELDLSGSIHYLNPTARGLFPNLETRGTAHPWLTGLETVLEDFRQGKDQTVRREVQVGESYYLQTVQFVAQSGRARIYSLDITARKEAEEALRQSCDELELRVDERTCELSDANQQLQQERRRFNDVLEMLPAYLILLTPDYHATFANRFFRERFGKEKAALVMNSCLGAASLVKCVRLIKSYRPGNPWNGNGPGPG